MNTILIRCDGENITINTTEHIDSIYELININISFEPKSNKLLGIYDCFKEKNIYINPDKVTVIKDITEKIGKTRDKELVIPLDCNDLNELYKEIKQKIYNDFNKS